MGLIHTPNLTHWRSNARNGMYPSAWLWRRIVDAENHITAYRHRQVYGRALALGTDTGGTQGLVGYGRFRTGYGVDRVKVVMLMGYTTAASGSGSTSDPYAEVTITDGVTPVTVGPFSYGVKATGTITDGPDEHMLMAEDMAVDEATTYTFTVARQGFARPLAIAIYELAPTTVDEATNYMNEHGPVGGSPIHDSHVERVLEGLSDMYRANGSINVHWSLYNGAARTRSSATFANLIDGTTTGTPTTVHRGFYLSPQHHNTASRSTVPFELAAYGSIGGGSGSVRLIDTAGNTYGPVTINGSADWYTAAIDLPASEAYYAFQWAGDGTNTVSVFGVSLIEHED